MTTKRFEGVPPLGRVNFSAFGALDPTAQVMSGAYLDAGMRESRVWDEASMRWRRVPAEEVQQRHVFSDGSGGMNREFSWWPCHGRYKGGNWWVHDRKGHGNDGPSCVDDFGSLVRCG